jgi:hypothetical protein
MHTRESTAPRLSNPSYRIIPLDMARKSPGRKRSDGASTAGILSSTQELRYHPQPASAELLKTPVHETPVRETPVRETPVCEIRYRNWEEKTLVNLQRQTSLQQQVDIVREFITEHLCDTDLSVLLWWENLRKNSA